MGGRRHRSTQDGHRRDVHDLEGRRSRAGRGRRVWWCPHHSRRDPAPFGDHRICLRADRRRKRRRHRRLQSRLDQLVVGLTVRLTSLQDIVSTALRQSAVSSPSPPLGRPRCPYRERLDPRRQGGQRADAHTRRHALGTNYGGSLRPQSLHRIDFAGPPRWDPRGQCRH